jgi:hypothetical protein
MNTEHFAKEHIKLEYERIMKSIIDGKIYGIPVDIYDIRHLVVASYYLGHSSYYGKMAADVRKYLDGI